MNAAKIVDPEPCSGMLLQFLGARICDVKPDSVNPEVGICRVIEVLGTVYLTGGLSI